MDRITTCVAIITGRTFDHTIHVLDHSASSSPLRSSYALKGPQNDALFYVQALEDMLWRFRSSGGFRTLSAAHPASASTKTFSGSFGFAAARPNADEVLGLGFRGKVW